MTNMFPRVLVVNGEPFSQRSATGLTLNSLFNNWPKENLACLSFTQVCPELDFCHKQWNLTFKHIPLLYAISRFVGKPGLVEGSVPPGQASGTPAGRSFLRQQLSKQSIVDLDYYRIPQQVIEEIDEFHPQVIYTMLAANRILKVNIDLYDRYKIPIVPHFMDDWPETMYRSSIFRPILLRRMKEYLDIVLKRSPVRLVIGDDMAVEYASRYGGNFAPFMNAVEPDILEQPLSAPVKRDKVRLIYVGGLHLNRWRSLREIGRALKVLTDDEGLEAELMIYTQPRFAHEALHLQLPPVMRVVGALTPAEVPAVLRDADILVHIESFDRASRKYTRYSVSTKIPECMAAARPILAYGPGELASIRYVHDSKAGIAVGSEDRKELISALRELITSETLRSELGMQGHEVAAKNHNAVLQREQFRAMLSSACHGN